MNVIFTIANEKGNRINSIKIDGVEIDPLKTYSLAACEREGDDMNTLCRMKNVKSVKDMPYTLHKVVEEYLNEKKIVAPILENRATATDAHSTLLSQLDGVNYKFK
jgi:hypothetical protein